jgi:hypothetical protein
VTASGPRSPRPLARIIRMPIVPIVLKPPLPSRALRFWHDRHNWHRDKLLGATSRVRCRCLNSRRWHLPAPARRRGPMPPARLRRAPGVHAARVGGGGPRPSRRAVGGARGAIRRAILAPMTCGRFGRERQPAATPARVAGCHGQPAGRCPVFPLWRLGMVDRGGIAPVRLAAVAALPRRARLPNC